MRSEPPLGIFARVFPVGPAKRVAAAVAAAGYRVVQLNLRALGLPTLPSAEAWAQVDPRRIRAAFAAEGLEIWGLSGTYNMVHPDPAVRADGTAAAAELVRRAPAFGARAVTLCTGSRDAGSMWTAHPDNRTEAAWRDLRAELEPLVAAALEAGIVLGVEPEPGNVVADAAAAERLLGELGPDARAIGIVADAANLLAGRPADTHRAVLERAFVTLHASIACLHAKDLVPWEATLAGRGVVDYVHVAGLYRRLGLAAPVIVQDVVPAQAIAARAHLARAFGAAPNAAG
jgi:sugar phosphate isomerase/epimerase